LETLVSSETKGLRDVFGFGHNEIGHVLFLGLHGLDVEGHVQGWEFFVVVLPLLLIIIVSFLIGPQSLEASDSTSFGGRTSLTSTFSFAFLFLLLDFLRREGSMNVAAMGLGVDVLVTGRTIHVPATMT